MVTNEEIIADIRKFFGYLEANGHTPVAITIMLDNGVSYAVGNTEMIDEMCLLVMTGRRGITGVTK